MKRIFTILFCICILLSTAVPAGAYASSASVLSISADSESKEISRELYGAFIEDISYSCDGGLVSNLVNNNSFEYEFNSTTAWEENKIKSLEIKNEEPLNENNPSYAAVTVDGKGSLTNLGYTELYDYKTFTINEEKKSTADMGFRENEEYDFSCYMKNESFEGTVSVYLNSKHNRSQITELDTSTLGTKWLKYGTALTSSATEDGGLTIEFNGSGTLYIDFISLVPKSSHGYGTQQWKYTSLRSDLYTALAQWGPAFIRFPGGCLAEGDSLEKLYNWKDTIGPLEERVQTYNLWRDDVGRDYINTNAMGYHEYFQLCSDIGAQPMPILNVGLICQARVGYDDHVIALQKASMSDSEWETYLTDVRRYDPEDTQGRQDFTDYINRMEINSRADFEAYLDTIALRPGTKEWDAYVQDILDLIEYANGDAQTSYWGQRRAVNGSEEPFNLKYLGLGNENWGEIYERNFKALYKAVKEAYPDITIISSAGTWLEGDGYDYNTSWINSGYTDTIIDEHYYTADSYLFSHNDRYDSFDRTKAHIFIGEYSARPQKYGTIQTKANMMRAVEEAGYLTGIERNGDIVDMTSPAPTFAKNNAMCWEMNLIWFDSQEVVLTPSYYVQMLFANNTGSRYNSSSFANGSTIENGIYESVTVDDENEVMYIKLVNTDGKRKKVNINLDGYTANKVSAECISNRYPQACNETGSNTVYPEAYEISTDGSAFTAELDRYDITVLRVAYGGNDGAALTNDLPPFISTMPQETHKFIPEAIKIAVPASVAAAVAVLAIAIAVTKIIRKKRNKPDNE